MRVRAPPGAFGLIADALSSSNGPGRRPFKPGGVGSNPTGSTVEGDLTGGPMNAQLEQAFGSLGARVKFTPVPDWQPRLRGAAAAGALAGADAARGVLDTLRVDVRRDGGGEYFDVRCDPRVTVEAADVRAQGRHLLLVARVPVEQSAEPPRSTLLCG